MIATREAVEEYLNRKTADVFGQTFESEEDITLHIHEHNALWNEIVFLEGEMELLDGEHLPEDVLKKTSTINDIVETFMEVIDNKTRVLVTA